MISEKTIKRILKLYLEDINNPIFTLDAEIKNLEHEKAKIIRKLSTLKMTKKHRLKISADIKEYLKDD